ncbi:MAG TPA: hypothetical protein DD379_03985 [Cyanobacteria bacterium UBA11162]|nr:hypothetical protein [Cyanobacteria bacterium UBA12227]HAX87418.1 hypothetical protein [Cyanobacteria bacterium UBA11370]HBL10565.1 hypothetical protein [Cyanobacteria bacterium UBA11162]HBY77193.1 hypothetical protein [Cyanobacteria bacterium UBA11148]
MKHHWIKFIHERNTYVVDLNHISSFACANNGRLMFWLPDGKGWIVIHPKTNPDAYQQILDYLEKTAGQSFCSELKAKLVR